MALYILGSAHDVLAIAHPKPPGRALQARLPFRATGPRNRLEGLRDAPRAFLGPSSVSWRGLTSVVCGVSNPSPEAT